MMKQMGEMPGMPAKKRKPGEEIELSPSEEGDEVMDLETTPLPVKEMPPRISTELPQVTKLKDEIKGLEKLELEKLNKMSATESPKEGAALREEVDEIKERIERLRKEKGQLESSEGPVDLTEVPDEERRAA